MEAVDTLDFGVSVRRYREPVVDGDPLDHQHTVLGFDLADRLDLKLLALDVDLTRFQRAGEGAR
jgi:hypothetical protein